MKLCPQCKTGFPDHVDTCPTHGGYLSEIVDLKPGMLIRNTYRIVRKIDEGGMGAVYLADQILMDEPRALKFLSRQLSRDEAFLDRFRREVRTLRQVRHKNVIDAGDLEQAEDDSLFFSMEFVDGPNLSDLRHHAPQPFDVRLALDIVRGIAEGLGAAHARGMVHRDIKPDNILMARGAGSWVPKIADFGIVATKETSATYRKTGGTLLTPPYAAPEQWRGTPAAQLDGRTDLYALGGVLFEILTGQTVFHAENYEGWAYEHANTPPRAPSRLRPDLANWRGLDELTLRLLAKNRDDRPRDVDEVLRSLDAISFGKPQTRLETIQDAQPARPQPAARPQPPLRSSSSAAAKKPSGKLGKIVIAAVLCVSIVPPLVISLAHRFSAAAPNPLLPPPEDSKACDAGNGASCVSVAKWYVEHTEVADHDALAFGSFSKACDAGNMEGCRETADRYNSATGVTADPAKATALYTKACNANDADSCASLAMYYLGGSNENFPKAIGLYKKACSLGDQLSCEKARTLKPGGGEFSAPIVQQPPAALPVAAPAEDLSHYSDECDAGQTASCATAGTNAAIAGNNARALELFNKGCDAGRGESCRMLGFMYEKGYGVQRNSSRASAFYAQAASLFSSACESGDPKGCEGLGIIYREGEGVEKDSDKARRYFNRSCSLGYSGGCNDAKALQ